MPTAEETKQRIVMLRKDIYSQCGFVPQTPKDFSSLSALIFQRTHCNVSMSTLKRVMGYLPNKQYGASKSTLDILSRYVGFPSYEDYLVGKHNVASVKDLRKQVVSIRSQLESVTDQLRHLEEEM